MPLAPDEVRIWLVCGVDEDGRRCGWHDVAVAADALRRLGLHPDRPTATVVGASPPGWWHAAAECRADGR